MQIDTVRQAMTSVMNYADLEIAEQAVDVLEDLLAPYIDRSHITAMTTEIDKLTLAISELTPRDQRQRSFKTKLLFLRSRFRQLVRVVQKAGLAILKGGKIEISTPEDSPNVEFE